MNKLGLMNMVAASWRCPLGAKQLRPSGVLASSRCLLLGRVSVFGLVMYVLFGGERVVLVALRCPVSMMLWSWESRWFGVQVPE